MNVSKKGTYFIDCTTDDANKTNILSKCLLGNESSFCSI